MIAGAGGLSPRFIRFVIVGVGAAALLFALILLFAALGMAPFAGSVLAYGIAFAVAYTAQRNWTFGARHGHAYSLPRYFAVQAGCAALTGLCAHIAVSVLAMPPLPMSAITTILASTASYVLSTLWVFPHRGRMD
jgi:putative flippase GtrA